jgi:hypothetical protein
MLDVEVPILSARYDDRSPAEGDTLLDLGNGTSSVWNMAMGQPFARNSSGAATGATPDIANVILVRKFPQRSLFELAAGDRKCCLKASAARH